MGTETQMLWLIVNEHAPFFTPVHVYLPGVTIGPPQHFVDMVPGLANGEIVTGTQMDAD